MSGGRSRGFSCHRYETDVGRDLGRGSRNKPHARAGPALGRGLSEKPRVEDGGRGVHD